MRSTMRSLLCCALLMFVGFSAYAQWFQVRSSAPSTALRLFSYQQVDFGESGVSADNGTQLEGAQFGLQSQYRVLNLYLLSFFKEDLQLEYSKPNLLASELDQNSQLGLSGDDLPSELHSEGWRGFLPIPLGESALFVRGGYRIASDRRDLSNEDYHSHVSLLFYPQAGSSDRWAFGAFQQVYLGQISDITPLAQYESNSGSLAWSVGFLHLPGSYDPPVLPYFGVSTSWIANFELELVYPRRLAVGLRPFAGVGLRLEFDDSTTRYRLARLAPWEGNILTLDQFRQQLTLDLHLLTNIELQLGVGKVTRREIILNDAALENELGKVEVDDSDLNQLGASLIINF